MGAPAAERGFVGEARGVPRHRALLATIVDRDDMVAVDWPVWNWPDTLSKFELPPIASAPNSFRPIDHRGPMVYEARLRATQTGSSSG
jgi:hypothetical protein